MVLLSLAAMSLGVTGYSQGTVFFDNLDVRGVNAPVFNSDGVTKISGNQFIVELLGGPSASNLSSIATTGFLAGNGAGYFNGQTQAIPGVAGGTQGWVEVLVWNTTSGSSFDQAKASGLPNSWWQSSVFAVQTGNPSLNPSTPGALLGLGTFPVYLNAAVPEPSTLALVGFAAVFLLFRFVRFKR